MTTPAGWYPDGSGQQRYYDGNQWTAHFAPAYGGAPPPPPPPPPPKNGVGTGVKVLVAIGAVVLVGTIANMGSDDKDSSASSNSTVRTLQAGDSTPASAIIAPSVASKPAGPTIAPAGSVVRDGKFSFEVLGVERSRQAGNLSNQFMTETAQGEFIVVTVGVRNVGEEPRSYSGSAQKLIDAAGREYASSSSVDMWVNGYIGNINPGNAVRVVMAFDVPPGTQAKSLELHDSLFSGGAQLAVAP